MATMKKAAAGKGKAPMMESKKDAKAEMKFMAKGGAPKGMLAKEKKEMKSGKC